jgi:CRP/FNR family transcriptional regulator, cyclic AMP receptor protein
MLERFAVEYEPGDVLFREGDRADVMYVIQAGEIEIRRTMGDVERVLAVLPAGEFLGEMGILTGRPRSATAVVRQRARLLVIEAAMFEAMLRGKSEIALRMIRALADRLERANQQIELLLLASPNHRVVQCLRRMADEQIAAAGGARAAGGGADGAIYLPIQLADLATRVALPPAEVADVIERLRAAQLVVLAEDAGIVGPGYVIPEVGQLLEFIEFLELRDRQRAAGRAWSP